MNVDKRFPLKRVVITGAGSGLGRALALTFGRLVWRVAVTDIHEERMKETARLVNEAGGDALPVHCDVTNPADIERVRDVVTAEWGGVDILVNNAGVATGGFLEKIPSEVWERVLATNLQSIILGCRTFIPLFKKQGGGHIVNVASFAGIGSMPEMTPYNASKAAAISISETLKIELAGSNIGITVACPTFFKTNLLEHSTFGDPRQARMAARFFAKSSMDTDTVARVIIKKVNRRKLYAIPQTDGRVLWFLKRHCPEGYFDLFAWLYKVGWYDKYLVGL
jgi:NAD(P)-dependent dehydrogenase (short-subunit alcohol dehydrogenase family)